MKSTLFVLTFFFYSIRLFSQLDKFDIGIEYSLGFSKVADGFNSFSNTGFHGAGNVFFKFDYPLSNKLDLTIGAGYLVTKEHQRLLFNFDPDDDFDERLLSHHYFVIPIGIKYRIGTFFINPEIGLALQDKHLGELSTFEFGPNSISSTRSSFQDPNSLYHPITIPAFLSFGNEFDFGMVKVLFGIKSYFSLTSKSDVFERTGNYYGIGVMTGVKF
jgi:hypothetical protein